jgi:hypothetical protein
VSFHTIPPLWRAELDFMADFVFMLLASGSGPARVTVQGRVSEEQKRDPSSREKQRFFPSFFCENLRLESHIEKSEFRAFIFSTHD